jgi:Na+-transporting NADH:ubiquinone oxidoreductase subunit NqrF
MILALNSVALLPPKKLSQSNIKVPVVVRSHYVAVDEYGRKITSSTGTGDWIHKDSAAKTIYSLGATGGLIEFDDIGA